MTFEVIVPILEVLFGIAEKDPTWGFTTGITWVFNAFTIKP